MTLPDAPPISRERPQAALVRSTLITGAVGIAGVALVASAARLALPLGVEYPVKAVVAFSAGLLAVFSSLAHHSGFVEFGAANRVTTARMGIAALVAALLGEATGPGVATAVVLLGIVAVALDGLDGRLARRSDMASLFGARFDLETDALLIFLMSVLAWRFNKAGAWVLASGLMRYAFVAAGWRLSWLRSPLPPRRRRQVVCVLQTVSLVVILAPPVSRSVSAPLAAATLFVLGASFVVDIVWLWRHRLGAAQRAAMPVGAFATWATLGAALFLLNASLTFENVWPTPAITWTGTLSVELGVMLVVLAAAARWTIVARRPLLAALAGLWVLLVFGRYADVTAPALYGREINLYWDLQFIPDVAAMLIRVAPLWLVAVVALAAAAALAAAYGVVRWALGQVVAALDRPRPRLVLGGVAAAALVAFAGLQRWPDALERPAFAAPVTATYARQVRLVAGALSGSHALAPSPSMSSDLSLVKGADVLLFFVESYGAVAYERPEFAARLAPGRARLERAIRASGHDVVSAFIESSTFGGSSWLAHLTLMSGVDVRDPETNARLMTEHRDTIVTTFSQHGYRTLAWMPGLRQRWPEGAFYRFDEVYGAEQFDYHGPEFGWFAIPDEFALARLDAVELGRPSRPPLFVFFPTLSTHTPFVPTPPYQPDWSRMLTTRPYDEADLEHIYDEPDWMHLGVGYPEAVSYAYASLAGFLERHATRDFVLILIGDHQPPAAVSGEGASWDVPIHVITNRRAVLDRLRTAGFRPGLVPKRPAASRMHALLPILLSAFGDQPSAPQLASGTP